jgi:tetratricopeptide (TPR) repeat protein
LWASRYEDAIASFRDALAIDSDFKPAKNGLCTSTALLKKLNEAVKACLSAASSDPHSAVPQYFLGVTYLELGEATKASTAFEAAARIEPRTARIHVGLGFACFRLKKYEEALKHFEYARTINKNVPYALSGIGAAYAQLKDYGDAEKVLRQVVSSNSDDATARYNLGLVCLARKKRNCALTQYNYLKIMGHSLAATLFTTLSQDYVLDVSKFKREK